MNKKRPLILVTNDDGITAKGIRSLVEVAKTLGDIVVVAPDSPQSGMGHAITVNNHLRLNKDIVFEGVDSYTCSGTPVDCVKLAIHKVLHKKPDLIVSGINHGSNCSTNVLYSGTMSAAVEGAMEDIPSIGFSLLDHSPDAAFEASKEIAKQVISNSINNDFPNSICLNVNIPAKPIDEIKGIRICRQAKAYWKDDFETRKDPLGKEYHWLTGQFENFDKGEDTDVWALEHNFVSVVPVQYDMTAHHTIVELNQWNL